MTLALDLAAALLLAAGIAFFCAGTVGLLRFPDLFSRLHALVKADNLGLGFVASGLALRAESWTAALEILAVWALALLASVTISHLIAHAAIQEGLRPWVRPK